MSDLRYLYEKRADRFALNQAATMKAVVTRANGGFDQLDYCDVPIPQPRAGEVLIKVLAAGVNNTEINTRLGWYSADNTVSTADMAGEEDFAGDDGGWNEQTPFPLIQGTDCCGEVVTTAPGHPELQEGQRVLVRACMRVAGFDDPEALWMASDFDGAFAEYVSVPVSEVFAVDCDWSDAELATIPCAYATAETMLQRAGINASDQVLVMGASGGVGSAAVQLSKRRGAKVVAVAAAEKLPLMKSLGADLVVDRNADLTAQLQNFKLTVIVDNVGGEGFGKRLKLLSLGGRVVSSGAIAGPMVDFDLRDLYLRDQQIIGTTAWDEPVFANLVSYIERDEIRPLLAKTFPLAEIATAQAEFMQKKHVGNFVLIP